MNADSRLSVLPGAFFYYVILSDGGVPVSSSRMKLLVHFLEFAAIDLSVDLRRLDAGMSEHFLNEPQVCSPSEQVCRKAMSQCVWRGFVADPNPFDVTLDKFPDSFAA
jgi:hypothetical protein